MRAGGRALSLLAVPLISDLLSALEGGPKPLADLRRALGSPPQTTMRGQLRTLTNLGVLERNRSSGFPGAVDYRLANSGRELIHLASVVESWLQAAPEQPLALGSVASKGTIKALVDGWSSTLVRALAARPLALTELDRLIPTLNYPSLERRLNAMRTAGLLVVASREGRGTPYTVSRWMRQAVGPLAAAALWERQQPAVTARLTGLDVEATFLLAMPMVDLPSDFSGSCRLAVEFSTRRTTGPAGVQVGIREGRVGSCSSRLNGSPDAIVSGSSGAWLRAAAAGDTQDLEIHGASALARTLVERFQSSLIARAATPMFHG